MRLPLALTLAFTLSSAAASAHADTLFDVNVTFTNQDYASGTVLLDTVNGAVTAGSLNIYDGTNSLLGTIAARPGIVQGQGQRGFYESLILFGTGPTEIELQIQGFGVVGYTGGPVCPVRSCYIYPTYLYFDLGTPDNERFAATQGALTPATSATPEPSSFALLGTGLLSLVTMGSRRLRTMILG